MTDDQLRADRDRLAESLFALRGRLTVSARDERLPESVRGLLVCLLHGQGIEDATQKGFVGQDHRPEHPDAQKGGEADQAGGGNRTGEGGEEAAEEVTIDYDPATRWLRQAGVTGPVEVTIHYDPATRSLREVVTWGKPVVFRGHRYEETND